MASNDIGALLGAKPLCISIAPQLYKLDSILLDAMVTPRTATTSALSL
jgi:hypothetical protein